MTGEFARRARPDTRAHKMTNREDQAIERIRRRIPSLPGGVLRVGIGDDAAVVRPSPGSEWVLTCDQFIEGVHFLGNSHPPEVVGYKALARATSDLAAMGAQPRLFLLSMALPSGRSGAWLVAMLKGMAMAGGRFGVRLAGGDPAPTSPPDGKVALHLTVLGEMTAGREAPRPILRSGARPGDAIFVAGPLAPTGWLGAAQLGLELVLRGMHRERRWRRLLTPHYYPVIHIALGRWLAQRRLASAMMDLSDGLSTDLDRLCRASGVGARLQQERLPLVAVPKELQSRLGCDALSLGLHGGEDYGLLFTVPKRLVGRIPQKLYNARLARIGEIVRGRGVKLIAAGGKASPLEPRGWDHFQQQDSDKDH